MRFSQRIGKRLIKAELDKEELSLELRNSLWTLVLELLIQAKSNSHERGIYYSKLTEYYRDL